VTTTELVRPVAVPDLLGRPAAVIERIHAARAWGPLAFVSLALYAAYRLLTSDGGRLSQGQTRAMTRARYALNASAGLRSHVATILHRQGHHS
jgi:hypothetical protein